VHLGRQNLKFPLVFKSAGKTKKNKGKRKILFKIGYQQKYKMFYFRLWFNSRKNTVNTLIFTECFQNILTHVELFLQFSTIHFFTYNVDKKIENILPSSS